MERKEKMLELFLQCCRNRPLDMENPYEINLVDFQKRCASIKFPNGDAILEELEKLKKQYSFNFEFGRISNSLWSKYYTVFNFSEQPPLILKESTIEYYNYIKEEFKIKKSFWTPYTIGGKEAKKIEITPYDELYKFSKVITGYKHNKSNIAKTITYYHLFFGDLIREITKDEYDNAMSVLTDAKEKDALEKLDKRLTEFNK